MKRILYSFIILLNFSCVQSQEATIDTKKVKEDLDQMLYDIKNNYIYFEDKGLDFDCISQKYTAKIEDITNANERLLFFEYLINELYDSHAMLMRNIRESYRLEAPIFVTHDQNKTTITNVWQTQIAPLSHNIIGAEVLQFNGVDFNQKIDAFPTICADKSRPEIRNWLANKIIAGKYSEPRILKLRLTDGTEIDFDVDAIQVKRNDGLLSVEKRDNIGIIRLHNSLGENTLITAFDEALDSLMDTDALILDLRNTTSGGNTFVARGIMSRFVSESKPYQLHKGFDESWDNQPIIKRSWAEYVSPRGKQYTKPVIILVGKWTGSMGEGISIGFDAMQRATIVGTEMKRLAGGSTSDFYIKNENLYYKLMTQKLFHLNGTPREKFVPANYVQQTSVVNDEALAKAFELLNAKK